MSLRLRCLLACREHGIDLFQADVPREIREESVRTSSYFDDFAQLRAYARRALDDVVDQDDHVHLLSELVQFSPGHLRCVQLALTTGRRNRRSEDSDEPSRGELLFEEIVGRADVESMRRLPDVTADVRGGLRSSSDVEDPRIDTEQPLVGFLSSLAVDADTLAEQFEELESGVLLDAGWQLHSVIAKNRPLLLRYLYTPGTHMPRRFLAWAVEEGTLEADEISPQLYFADTHLEVLHEKKLLDPVVRWIRDDKQAVAYLCRKSLLAKELRRVGEATDTAWRVTLALCRWLRTLGVRDFSVLLEEVGDHPRRHEIVDIARRDAETAPQLVSVPLFDSLTMVNAAMRRSGRLEVSTEQLATIQQNPDYLQMASALQQMLSQLLGG